MMLGSLGLELQADRTLMWVLRPEPKSSEKAVFTTISLVPELAHFHYTSRYLHTEEDIFEEIPRSDAHKVQ